MTSRFPKYSLLAATMIVLVPFQASAAPKAAQLVDVSPNHWSYPAIKSLMEKYKVMSGYPDMTFRGTKPVSRYELAAALAAIIEKLDRPTVDEDKLLDFDKKTIEKLRAEFKSELAANSGSGDVNKRITAVEADFKTLQKNFDSLSKVKGSVSTTFMDQMNNKYFPYLASDISLKFAGNFSDKISYETKIGGGLAASQTGNTPAIANGDKPPESTAKFGSAKMTYADKNFNNLKVVIGRCSPTGFGLGGFAGHTGDGIIGSGLTGFGGNTVRDGGDINISSSMGLGPLKVATGLTSKAVLGNVSLEA
ncbi:MAG TPA: S-layer homology domain-containing protein, partial [Chroococcales cyanobacterium]